MALLYLGVLGLGVMFIALAEPIAAEDSEHSAAEMHIMWCMFCAMGGVLMLMYAIAPAAAQVQVRPDLWLRDDRDRTDERLHAAGVHSAFDRLA